MITGWIPATCISVFYMHSELILASRSPRRIEMLTILGVEFRQIESGVCEEHELTDPHESAGHAALLKARSVAKNHPEALVIGADTVVISPDGEMLGKPQDVDEAVETLMKLSGKSHVVITALAIVGKGREDVETESSTVWMRPFTECEALRYVASGEPMDKAGAYGIQVRGALLVERIEGCYFNVVGLPLGLLQRMLRGRGIDTEKWLGPDQV